jgi:streptogramin lyase
MTPSGALTEFPLPAGNGLQGSLTAGPDGNLWFIEDAGAVPEIARITPAGAITAFPVPALVGTTLPSDLTAGPDGNLWFTEYAAAGPEIARITPAGALAEFPLPAGYSLPSGLTAGPDGNLWFTEDPPGAKSPGAIVRITPSGALAAFPLPAGYSLPSGLTAGPDGNLWFTEDPSGRRSPGAIVRMTPSGALTKFSLPTRHAYPGDLTVGPDGKLWSIGVSGDGTMPVGRIDRIDPTPPSVRGVVASTNSRGAITSILVSFDEALDPAPARNGHSYGLATGVGSGPTIVFSQGVKIARVSYHRAAHAVRLKLARPQQGPIQVTVRAGLVAADGMSSFSDFTAVVT